MAIRFQLPTHAYADMVVISVNGFPAATPEDFLGLLNAAAASGPAAASPSPIEQFLGSHPKALKFVQIPKPAPVSFATLAFYGVNAFQFTNAKGVSRYGRYRIMPLLGEQHLSEAAARTMPPNYLMDDLPARLQKAPVKFRISVQLANAADSTNDGTEVWPEDRPQVELGVMTLDKAVADNLMAQKALAFSPLNLVDGISPSADPVLLARPAAYAISVVRRNTP